MITVKMDTHNEIQNIFLCIAGEEEKNGLDFSLWNDKIQIMNRRKKQMLKLLDNDTWKQLNLADSMFPNKINYATKDIYVIPLFV
jgi:hypothetical protein